MLRGHLDCSSRLFDEEVKFAVPLHLCVRVIGDLRSGSRAGNHVVIEASRVRNKMLRCIRGQGPLSLIFFMYIVHYYTTIAVDEDVAAIMPPCYLGPDALPRLPP